VEKWTREDERQLQVMQERKERVEAQRDAELRPIARQIAHQLARSPELPENALRGLETQVTDALVGVLKNYADTLRDALAPFDSGVREAKPQAG
jgi:hypothetical protein